VKGVEGEGNDDANTAFGDYRRIGPPIAGQAFYRNPSMGDRKCSGDILALAAILT